MAKQIVIEITDLETGEVELSNATVIESAEQLKELFAQHGVADDEDECKSFEFMLADNGQTCDCVTCKTNAAEAADWALTEAL